MITYRHFCLAFAGCVILGNTAQGTFHFMQIEQVIGGVNGDTTAQAIQLRMRFAGQNLVNQAAVRVVDAAGANSVLLDDMTTNVLSGQGRRILLATPNFANYTNIPLVADFIMVPIPASYLPAGQVRFTNNGSAIYWSLSWGGAGYTGSTTGLTDNDVDGNFGPPVNMALPSTTLQALQFTGTETALSTNNAAQYALTAGAATFINNAGTSFVVTANDPVPGDYNGDDEVNAEDYDKWRQDFASNVTPSGSGADGNGDGIVNAADYVFWRDHFGQMAGSSAGAVVVPEPAGVLLVMLAVGALGVWRRS
jgi:hypothetical protein